MKSASIYVAFAATLLVMSGCAGSENNTAKNSTAPQSDIALASDAKTADSIPGRQFIRTSDMKFRVKDVADATTRIEHIVRQQNGFVTYTNLKSTVEEQKVTQKSLDSSLEHIRYVVTNDITLRVPNNRLDSTLNAIDALVDFWDYRIIKADDVALQIKANQQAQARALRSSQHIDQNISNKKGNLAQANDAVASGADRQAVADNAAISNLALKDQVDYSTVTLSIYQQEETRYWTIANPDTNIRAGLGIRLWDAVKTGWYFAGDLLAGIIRLWFIILLILGGYIVYRKYLKKRMAGMWK